MLSVRYLFTHAPSVLSWAPISRATFTIRVRGLDRQLYHFGHKLPDCIYGASPTSIPSIPDRTLLGALSGIWEARSIAAFLSSEFVGLNNTDRLAEDNNFTTSWITVALLDHAPLRAAMPQLRFSLVRKDGDVSCAREITGG